MVSPASERTREGDGDFVEDRRSTGLFLSGSMERSMGACDCEMDTQDDQGFIGTVEVGAEGAK